MFPKLTAASRRGLHVRDIAPFGPELVCPGVLLHQANEIEQLRASHEVVHKCGPVASVKDPIRAVVNVRSPAANKGRPDVPWGGVSRRF
jgi:hypothetical protein